jgi:hypothetical protein
MSGTSAVAAAVDPGLVDVVCTLGYQNAISAGTGLVLTSSGECCPAGRRNQNLPSRGVRSARCLVLPSAAATQQTRQAEGPGTGGQWPSSHTVASVVESNRQSA